VEVEYAGFIDIIKQFEGLKEGFEGGELLEGESENMLAVGEG
jgi:hypothetical protein